jgi:hypothetical protein
MFKISTPKITLETYHVYRSRESLNGILDDVHDTRMRATIYGYKPG